MYRKSFMKKDLFYQVKVKSIVELKDLQIFPCLI